MTTDSLFKELLKDDIFIKKYGLTKEELEDLKYSDGHPPHKIIDILKRILIAQDSQTSELATFKQIKMLLNIK